LNYDGSQGIDGTHRVTECRGRWYADRFSAGVGPVDCRMISNNRAIWQRDPGLWAGGLPIITAGDWDNSNTHRFPGSGWGKTNNSGSYNVPGQLTIKCVDFAGQTASDCMPRNYPCPVDTLAPELICSPSYTGALQGDPVTLYALGGVAPFTWTASGGNPNSGSGNTFTVSFGSTGLRFVNLRDSTSQQDACTVRVYPP
jgi:hypothetical protein